MKEFSIDYTEKWHFDDVKTSKCHVASVGST
jgi:hypothetical protein